METADPKQSGGTPSRWKRRLGRIGMGFVAVLIVGAIFEQVGGWRDNRRFPPPGARVDIGDGRRMYLDCRGSGSPTVLLEAGHWSWSSYWTVVQPQITSFTRVCSYDRAGLGLSDTGPTPRTVAAVNADKERLLERAGVAPPYVLVGHSAGGMYQRVFQAAHRDRVAGMVFVDCDVPGDESDRREIENAPDDRKMAAMFVAVTHVGLYRFLTQTLRLPVGHPRFQEFPEEARYRLTSGMTRMARAINGSWDLYRTAYVTVPSEPFGDLPVVVIAALGYRSDAKDKEDWLQRQKKLTAMSTRGRLVALDDADHQLPFFRPEVVVSAVREVVEAARAGKPQVGIPGQPATPGK